ncbi:MAG: baseplate J/gp47 family protein [Spirochaetaceae bacterium]|jgi:hypothetical protein|nr:baseplate J/gp47 family protein [Spirochaetaceae bacterium]
MANIKPSLEELRGIALSHIESALNLHTPDNEKAYNKVLATTLAALADINLYFSAAMAKEAFIRTASIDGLSVFGEGFNIYPDEATRWSGKIQFSMPPFQKLPISTVFVSSTGFKYITKLDYYADDAGICRPIVEALEAGATSNIEPHYQLALQVPISGADVYAEIIEVLSYGTDAERIEHFRQRVLDIQQSERGSANSGDYRIWAQAVTGVKRAYPFTGRPVTMPGNSLPLESTTYIECTEDIQEDGIAPQSLLDKVKEALVSNPETGESRLIIGHTADTIYVRPIVRTDIYISIFGLIISNGDKPSVQQEIRDALDIKLRSIEPYVAGLDPEYTRNEDVTESILMQDVQNILDAYNGRINNITFGTTPTENTSRIVLNRNQKLKLFQILFID